MFGFYNFDYVPRRQSDSVPLYAAFVRTRELLPTKWIACHRYTRERERAALYRHVSRHKRRLLAWRRRERLAHPKVAWERSLVYA